MTTYQQVPSHPGFRAGSDGTIVGPTGRVRRSWLTNSGYLHLQPRYRSSDVYVHVMVCEAFHGPRPTGMEVAHYDGDRLNNRPDNLRWATHQDNEADKIRHDRVAHGERNGHAKLTSDQVAGLRSSRSGGATLRTLAARYDISVMQVSRISRGLNWSHTL